MQQSYILAKGVLMLLIALGGVAAAVLVGFFASRTAAGVAKQLRHDVFAKVESFSSKEFDQFSTASLITRTTNDVQQIQMLIVMGIRMMCYAPILGIGGIIMAVGKSVSLSWIIAAAVVVLIGLILVIFAVALPKFKILQKLTDRINLVSRENLSGMMEIRAFGNQKHEEDRFEVANRNLRKYRTLYTACHGFDDACHDPRDEPCYTSYCMGRRTCHCRIYNANRRYDRFYAVCHADYYVIPDDCHDVHYGAACFRFSGPDCRGS